MKNKPISVRLGDEAMKKCKEAKEHGYTVSEFIEQAIMEIPIQNKVEVRDIAGHFCRIETIVESMRNGSTKNEIREELNEVCRILRLLQETT